MDIIKGGLQRAKATVVDQTDVKTAIIKATSIEVCPPKEKHVQTLIRVSEGEEPDYPPTRLVRSLDKRLHEPEWIVVLKTLVVAHRLFIHGNKKFVNALLQKRDLFLLGAFSDSSSQEALSQTSFIRRYARYLEEKLFVVNALNLDVSKGEKHFLDMTETQLFEHVQQLQKQLDVIFECELIDHYLTNTATLSAYELLLKDSMILFRLISKGVMHILDTYFSMSKDNARQALQIYKQSVKHEKQLIDLYISARSWDGLPAHAIPEIRKTSDPSFLTSLEQYLSEDQAQTASLSDLVGDKLSLLDTPPTQAPPSATYVSTATGLPVSTSASAVPKLSASDAPVRGRAQSVRPQQPVDQDLLFINPTAQEKASEILNLFNAQPVGMPMGMGAPMPAAAAALRARTGTLPVGVPAPFAQAPYPTGAPMMPTGAPYQPAAHNMYTPQRSASVYGAPPMAPPTNPFLNPAAFGAAPGMQQRSASVYGQAPINPFLGAAPMGAPAPAQQPKVSSPPPAAAPPKNPTVDDFF